MKTQNIIQSNVNVIRITQLTKGNVYKRVEDSYNAKIIFGVVLDLMNTGEKTFIHALEYEAGYHRITPSIKVFGGNEDISIFPATIEELQTHFKDAVQGLAKDIENKRKELETAEIGLKHAQEFMEGELSKTLTEASYTELSQSEYESKKAAALQTQKKLAEVPY